MELVIGWIGSSFTNLESWRCPSSPQDLGYNEVRDYRKRGQTDSEQKRQARLCKKCSRECDYERNLNKSLCQKISVRSSHARHSTAHEKARHEGGCAIG